MPSPLLGFPGDIPSLNPRANCLKTGSGIRISGREETGAAREGLSLKLQLLQTMVVAEEQTHPLHPVLLGLFEVEETWHLEGCPLESPRHHLETRLVG